MKKIIIIVLLLLIGVSSGVYFFLKKDGISPLETSIDQLFPQEPLIYINIDNLNGNMAKIQKSQTWQALQEIDYDRLIETAQIPMEQKNLFRLIKEQLKSNETVTVLKKVLGKEFALAIFPSEEDLFKLDVNNLSLISVIENAFSKVVVVVRMPPDVKVLEMMARKFETFGSDIQIETSEHKGYKLNSVIIPQQRVQLVYTTIKDFLVIGLGDYAARTAIDVYSKDQLPLAQDENFKKMKDNYISSAALKGFWDFKKFFNFIEEYVLKAVNTMEERIQVQASFSKLLTFHSFGFSADFADVAEMRFDLGYDPENLEESVAKLYANCQNKDNKTLAFVPEEVLAYQWISCFDMEFYWGEMKKEMERLVKLESQRNVDVKQTIDEFERRIGFDVEKDILPAFGKEVGGVLDDVVLGGPFPMPKLALFVQVGQKAKAEKLIQQLVSKSPMPLQQERYAATQINYVMSPIGEFIEPAYCFIDGYLLLSTHRKLLQETLDVFKSKTTSLADDPNFKLIDKGLSQQATSVQYAHMSKLSEKAKTIFELSLNIMENQDRKQNAFRSGSVQRLKEQEEKLVSLKAKRKITEEAEGDLRTKIKKAKSDGINVTAKEKELEIMTSKLKGYDKEIMNLEEEVDELEGFVKGYESSAQDKQYRDFYLNDIVYPMLKVFGAIKSYGARVLFQDNMIKTAIFFKE